MFEREDLHPQQELVRHAKLLSAAHNPPLISPRGEKQVWNYRDFLKADPWAPPKPKKPLTKADTLAQIAAVNAIRRKK